MVTDLQTQGMVIWVQVIKLGRIAARKQCGSKAENQKTTFTSRKRFIGWRQPMQVQSLIQVVRSKFEQTNMSAIYIEGMRAG